MIYHKIKVSAHIKQTLLQVSTTQLAGEIIVKHKKSLPETINASL